MESGLVERHPGEPPAGPVRFRLAFRARTAATAWVDGMDVALDHARVQWGERGGKALREIARILLWPYDQSEEPSRGRCDIRFGDGTLLTVTSDKPYKASKAERDAAYAGFLHALHARLDEETRARIEFQDGLPLAKLMTSVIIVFALFCGPTAFLLLNAWLAPGLPWLLALGALLLAACGLAVWAAWRRGPRLYAPDRLPRRALP